MSRRKNVLKSDISKIIAPFTGFWLYISPDCLNTENLSIEYAGKKVLLNIIKTSQSKIMLPPVSPGAKATFIEPDKIIKVCIFIKYIFNSFIK